MGTSMKAWTTYQEPQKETPSAFPKPHQLPIAPYHGVGPPISLQKEHSLKLPHKYLIFIPTGQ